MMNSDCNIWHVCQLQGCIKVLPQYLFTRLHRRVSHTHTRTHGRFLRCLMSRNQTLKCAAECQTVRLFIKQRLLPAAANAPPALYAIEQGRKKITLQVAKVFRWCWFFFFFFFNLMQRKRLSLDCPGGGAMRMFNSETLQHKDCCFLWLHFIQ